MGSWPWVPLPLGRDGELGKLALVELVPFGFAGRKNTWKALDKMQSGSSLPLCSCPSHFSVDGSEMGGQWDTGCSWSP